MTIAACYVTPEGVVLGADSTLSFFFADGSRGKRPHYFNYGQKIFQIGEDSTLGIANWGLSGVGLTSHRSLIADLAFDLKKTPATSLKDVAERWIAKFWGCYWNAYGQEIARSHELAVKQERTAEEDTELAGLDWLVAGFCIGGRLPNSSVPGAYFVTFNPREGVPPAPSEIVPGGWSFWGAPNPIQRLLFGMDDELLNALIASGKWTGNAQDIRAIMSSLSPTHDYLLPLREAIDFVHSSIYTTIKSLKFSKLHQICGGPVEVAVITTDRNFRWVRHKRLGDAISLREGDDGYQA